MFHKTEALFQTGIRCSKLLVFSFLFMGTLAHATEGVENWVRHYRGPLGNDQARAVAVDGVGNIFVTGASGDEFGVADFATVAFSGAGVPLWTNRFNGTDNREDEANGIAVDTNGNVFVIGFTESESSFYDFVTIKYSNAGAHLWTRFYNSLSANSDRPAAIALDSSGKVFVTGRSQEEDFSSSWVTIAYSNAGVPLWTNYFDGGGPRAMVVDKNGDIIVTGGVANPTNNSGDYATVKYSNVGVPLWTNRFDTELSDENDTAFAVATDTNGTVFVTGKAATSGGEFTTIAYSSVGVPLWTNQLSDMEIDEGRVSSIAVGPNGNIFVTGYLMGNNLDYATIAYSNAGIPLWTNFYSGSFADRAFAIVVDTNSNVFVTGSSNESEEGLSDIVTIAYSGAGVPLWEKRYGSGPDQSDSPVTKESIAVTGIGQIVVVGYSGTTNADETEYAILKYSTVFPSATPTNIVAALSGNNLELSWPESHKGWQLQWQTNTSGIGTNWNVLPGSTFTNHLMFPASGSSVFFRLMHP